MATIDHSMFQEFIEHPERFLIRPQTDTLTIGTTVGELAPLDPRRVHLRIINRDTVNAAWGFRGDGLTYANGDLLAQGGGSVDLNWLEDRDTVTAPLYAIGNAATVLVRRTFFLLERRGT